MSAAARLHPRASLRRADWRFLLPCAQGVFQHLVLLGGPPGLADLIEASGIARKVSIALHGGHSADAVAVLAGARAAIGDAADCLAPGGVLYYEIDRRSTARLATTPGRLQRQLRSAGLSPAGIYWAAPNFVNCRRYIPLDAPGAFRWYLATLFIGGTPAGRFIETAARLFSRLRGDRWAALAPCFAVTAIAGERQAAAPSVLGHAGIPSDVKKLILSEAEGPGLRPLVLTSGQDDGSRVIVLPFSPGASHPVAVFKASTLGNFNACTEREQAALAELHARLDAPIAGTIPRPLGLFRYGGISVGVESCAAGRPISVSSGQWGAAFEQQTGDLYLAARWLVDFHRQTQIERRSWDTDAIRRWIETPFVAYAETFGLSPGEGRLFDAARQSAGLLCGRELPLVRMHYDFGPWNLYRDAAGLTVVDWEFGRDWAHDRYGPALYDLLYFVTYWNHAVHRLKDEKAERLHLHKLFVEPDRKDPYVNAIHRVIDDYLAAFDLEPRFLPLILVYLWVEQALYQFARKRLLGESPSATRQAHTREAYAYANRCLGYIGVLAGSPERLFAGSYGS